MDNYTTSLINGNRLFKTADHLAYITYPFIKDNKLIISITENLYNSLVSTMTALIQFEAYYKRIDYAPSGFMDKIKVLKEHCLIRYNLNQKHIEIIQNLHDLMRQRKTSIMEFCRNDKYIIYNDFGVKSISISTLRNYIFISKDFMKKTNLIIQNAK